MVIAVAFAVQTAAFAHVLDNWHWRNPLPQGNVLEDVVYGAGLFVAVGEVGTVLTSPDGTNWTQRASGVRDSLRSCVYANGRFVAVGDYGVIVTSDDATNWIPRFTPAFYTLHGITHANGLFVAVGEETTILTSPDGIAWTQRASGPLELRDVAFGGNRFVAVGAGVFTSLDGINWTHQYSRRPLETVHWANGKFVAGVRSDPYSPTSLVAVSSDGEVWNEYGYKLHTTVEAVIFANGGWIAAMGGYDGGIYHSPDAITWSRVATVEPTLSAFALKDGTVIASSFRGSFLMSQDMTTWFDPLNGIPQFHGASDLAYGHLGYAGVDTRSVIFSSDGLSWTNFSVVTNLAQNALLRSIVYGKGLYVVGGEQGSMRVSSDGSTWVDPLSELNSEGFNSDIQTIVFDNGFFVAVPLFGTNILTSSDGYDWQITDVSGTFGFLQYPSLTAADGRFTLANHNRFGVSTNGRDWVMHSFEESVNLYGVAEENGRFLAHAYGTAFVSPDRTSWTRHELPPNVGPIRASGGFFLALPYYSYNDESYRGAVWSSRDGVEWTRHDIATRRGLFRIHYLNGSFWLIGGGGLILQSDPIVNLRLSPGRPLEISGPANRTCAIEASEYATGPWQPFTNVVPTNAASWTQIEVGATNHARFFRASLLPE